MKTAAHVQQAQCEAFRIVMRFNPHKNPVLERDCDCPVTNEETEAKGKITCPRLKIIKGRFKTRVHVCGILEPKRLTVRLKLLSDVRGQASVLLIH